jgi:ankyrin repeat protein
MPLQAAQLLLDRGADVNSKGGLYGNALQAASMGGHEEVGRLLRNEGADVNVQADFYARALREALSRT